MSPIWSSTTSKTLAPPKPFSGFAWSCFLPDYAKCNAKPKTSTTSLGIDSRSFFDDPTQCKGFRSLNIEKLYPNGSKKEMQSCYCDPRPRRTTSACVSVSVGFTKNRMDVSLNSPGLCHREERNDPWRNRNLPPIFLPSPCPIALAQLAFCLHALRKDSRSEYIF